MGGTFSDSIRLFDNADPSASSIGGNVTIDLGGDGGFFNTLEIYGIDVGGDVMITSTEATSSDQLILGFDSTQFQSTYAGNVSIDLGDGDSSVTITGNFTGTDPMIDFTGGAGVDSVSLGGFDSTTSMATVNVDLGAGDDIFTLVSNVSNATLNVDFSNAADTFTNSFGDFVDFDVNLMGLGGFDIGYASSTSTLTFDQLAAGSDFEIDNDAAFGRFRVDNGSDLFAADNLVVNLADGTDMFDLQIERRIVDDVMINAGDGDRTINFTGTNNDINGDLHINAGTGDQIANLSVNAHLDVLGQVAVDLGEGDDTVEEDGNDVSVTGNASFTGVNNFDNNGTMNIGGNLMFDQSGESTSSVITNTETLMVGGNFHYTGGDQFDDVFLNGTATTIGGYAMINLGDGLDAFQEVNFANASGTTTIGGDLMITSTNSTNGDVVVMEDDTAVGGHISIDLGGGDNDATILGVLSATSPLVSYMGGDGVDTVIVGTTGSEASFDFVFGDGDDSLQLNAGTAVSPNTLTIDFGGGTNTFDNQYGQFDFDVDFKNLNGFDHFYRATLDQWNLVQTSDDGDIVIDNNGTSGELQLINNGTTTMLSDAAHLRVNLMHMSTGNLEIDLDNPLAGGLILSLNNGDRMVHFTGSDNTIGEGLRIEAGTGDQVIDLAVNADHSVGQSSVINLRDGNDVVMVAANTATVTDFLVLRGVNAVDNTGTLDLGNFLSNTRFFDEAAMIDNAGTINITGNLTYLGGENKDDIIFDNGVTIGGNAFFDLGENTSTTDGQSVVLTESFDLGGNLVVRGGQSTGGLSFMTDATTQVGGFFVVDFSLNDSTPNMAVFAGTYNDPFGFYNGSAGEDHVSLNVAATAMDLFMELGDGDDELDLDSATDLGSLYVNFDAGTDTLTDGFGGTYPFGATFNGLE